MSARSNNRSCQMQTAYVHRNPVELKRFCERADGAHLVHGGERGS